MNNYPLSHSSVESQKECVSNLNVYYLLSVIYYLKFRGRDFLINHFTTLGFDTNHIMIKLLFQDQIKGRCQVDPNQKLERKVIVVTSRNKFESISRNLIKVLEGDITQNNLYLNQ